MKVFFTGATGVIGNRAVPLLIEAGHDVTAVARSGDGVEWLDRSGARPVSVDLFDPQDGGGKVRAARHPLHGAHRVARFLVGVAPQTPDDTTVAVVRVNGAPAFAGLREDACLGIVAFDIDEGLVSGIHAILNPDKLSRVGPL